MPASNWMAGLTMLLTARGANSARKMLQQTAMGTPRTAAPKVTDIEPIIIGKIPYAPRLGAHSMPKTKFTRPTLAIIGNPSIKIKAVMSARVDNVERAIRKNMRPVVLPIDLFTFPYQQQRESALLLQAVFAHLQIKQNQ